MNKLTPKTYLVTGVDYLEEQEIETLFDKDDIKALKSQFCLSKVVQTEPFRGDTATGA
jgi:hypothetical protein